MKVKLAMKKKKEKKAIEAAKNKVIGVKEEKEEAKNVLFPEDKEGLGAIVEESSEE